MSENMADAREEMISNLRRGPAARNAVLDFIQKEYGAEMDYGQKAEEAYNIFLQVMRDSGVAEAVFEYEARFRELVYPPVTTSERGKQYFLQHLKSDEKSGQTDAFDYLYHLHGTDLKRGQDGFRVFLEFRELVKHNSFRKLLSYDERFSPLLDAAFHRKFEHEQREDGLRDYREMKRAKAQNTFLGRLLHHPIMYKK